MIRTPLRQRKRLISRQSPAFLALGLLGVAAGIPSQASAQNAYTLKTTPRTVAWGYSNNPRPVEDASSQTSEQPLVYVKHLEPPSRYPPLARQTRISGTVFIKLTIAPDGTVRTVEPSPGKEAVGHPLLREYAEKLVKTWTFGCVGCAAGATFEQTISVKYELAPDDDVSVINHIGVVMNLPDEVIIKTDQDVCDHCPAPKNPKKGSH